MYTCQQYHRDTSYRRYGMDVHRLDWANQPEVFKQYPPAEELDLGDPGTDLVAGSLWEALAASAAPRSAEAIMRRELSRILSLAYSLTAGRRHPGGTFYYRTVASAGALYPTELYVCAPGSEDMPAGLYHYDIAGFRLTRLRSGELVARAATLVPAWRRHLPAAAFFISGIFFRSAWKYRKRAYRYVLLDAGHLLASLFLAHKALGFPALPSADFEDAGIDVMLGIDGRREACLACLAIAGQGATTAPGRTGRISPLPEECIQVSRVSAAEVAYAEIGKIHGAGSAVSVQQDVSGEMNAELGVHPDVWRAFEPGRVTGDETDFAIAVQKRRSRRNYLRQPLSRQKFQRLLELVWMAQQHDMTGRPMATVVSVGFLAGNIEGLAAGFYLLDSGRRRYGLVEEGRLVEEMAAVCLDQQWLAKAPVHFLFMANMDCLDRWLGPRGYRHAMLSAGCLGQVVYLGATALGLGACGIGALYDGEAQALLGLNDRSALLYLVAAGPVKRP